MHATGTSCADTACPVSPIVSTAFAGSFGYIVSEAKAQQDTGYYDGQATVYGGSNPNIWIGLEASLDNSARNSYNPLQNFRTFAINVSITDSSGNIFRLDSSSIATSVWDTPYPTGFTIDYFDLINELSGWLAEHLGVPTPPDITTFRETPNGYYVVSNTLLIAQWTNYPDPCVTSAGSSSCGNASLALYDKSLRIRIIPTFSIPDVYKITIGTRVERGSCYQNVSGGQDQQVTIVDFCLTMETQTQSYSFSYVYENDAGKGAGDEADSLPNAGSPVILPHGSYTGFLYGIDTADVYGFEATQGEKISFTVTPPTSADFGLTLYDPGHVPIGTQDLGTGMTNAVAFTANPAPAASGTYFAKISLVNGWGTYSFTLSDQFQMAPSPSAVSLGLVGTASSATSTITVSSPTDFSGRVDLTTLVTPAAPYGPITSLSTVSKSVVASPTAVVRTSYSPENPSNAFADDSRYAVIDNGGDCCTQEGVEYGGYSVSLPPDGTITKVELLIDHYEQQYGQYPGTVVSQVVIQGSCGGCPDDDAYLPHHSSETRDVIDVTSKQSSWTATIVSSLSVMYWAQGSYWRSLLDWLAVRVTYTTSSVTLTPGSSDTRILTISKGVSTLAGVYTVTVAGNSGISLSVPLTVSVQDFRVTASPTSLKIPPNQSRTTKITVSPANGFSGSVTLSANAIAGYTTTFSTNPVTGGSGSSVLTVTHTGPPAADPSTITVTASGGGRVHTVDITVYNPPPDFTISATPNPATLTAELSGDFTVNVSSLYGFTGSVSLSPHAPPGLSCSELSQPAITLTSTTTSASSTLNCSAPAGVYSINVTGTSGGLSHFQIIAITVQDFSVSANPDSLILDPGYQIPLGITVTYLYGFTGTVTLTDVVPMNLTCGAIAPTSVTAPVSTASVACGSSIGGTYTLTVTGTSGSLSRSIDITLYIRDFQLSVQNLNTVWAAQGQSGTAVISVQSVNGFSGTLTFTANGMAAGSSCLFDMNQLTLASYDFQQVTCTISASGNMALGTYSFTVSGTSASRVHTVTVSFRVLPSPININKTATFNNVTASLSGSVTDDTLIYQLYGTVYLTATNNTSGVTIASNKPVSIHASYGTNGQVVFLVEIDISPYWLSVNCSVNVTTGSSNCGLSRTLDIDHDGDVDIFDVATAGYAYGTTPGSQNWNPRADFNGDQSVNIMDMATLAFYFNALAFL